MQHAKRGQRHGAEAERERRAKIIHAVPGVPQGQCADLHGGNGWLSLLEVPVANAMHRFSWSRKRACVGLGSVIFMLGIPASLGFGPWAGLKAMGGRGILDALAACDLHESRLGRLWYFSVRYTVPLMVAVVLVRSVWWSAQ